MPAGGIHLCVAKEVASRLNINQSMSYFIGNVAPDSWRNSSSTKNDTHFISNEDSFDYNYDYFYEKYKDSLDNEFVLGYLIHLITDKYWHSNNFITTRVSSDEYDELNKACSNIISKYNIQRLYLSNDLVNPVEELETLGIEKTINYLNSVNYLENKDSIFSTDELISRINETSLFVINELLRLQSKNRKNSR